MIDSKKLAATPLTEYEIGSDNFCLVAMCQYDNGKTTIQMSLELRIPQERLTKAINKGRKIRDRIIRDNSHAMFKSVQSGDSPVPYVNKEVPDVRVVAVSIMCPPRGVIPARQHEPIKITHATPLTVQ